jgi:hypothetical protein
MLTIVLVHSHLIMVSQPEAVTDVILEAARSGATQ